MTLGIVAPFSMSSIGSRCARSAGVSAGTRRPASVAAKVSPSRSGDRGGVRGRRGCWHRTAHVAHRSGGPDSAALLTALFTATSAVCVTGLIVVDTPVYWSAFGQVVILAMIQVGGFGIPMTLASLVGLLIWRRLGLRSRLIAAAETKQIGLGDVRRVIVGVVKAESIVRGPHRRIAHCTLRSRLRRGVGAGH